MNYASFSRKKIKESVPLIPQGLTLEELIEAGTKGLRKGAMKYNLEADYKFISYAVWWIRQSIMQAIEEKR